MSWQAKKIRNPPEHWAPNTLTKKVQSSVNKMVRAKFAEKVNGWVTCVTCGKRMGWSEPGTHAGHFRPGNSVRFVEINIHPQCFQCNEIMSSNQLKYEQFMIDTYGKNVVEWIKQMERLERRYSRMELLLIRAEADMRMAGYIEEKML